MEQVDISGIRIFYEPQHDGGGIKFESAFIDFLQQSGTAAREKRYKHCMEFCSGPGFIGFSLLGAGLIDQLTLLDINEAVRPGIEKTIDHNLLQNKVRFIRSDGLDVDNASSLSDIDLIVSNPPHIDVLDPNTPPIPYKDHPIIYADPGFSIHRKFFASAPRVLTGSGEILFIENAHFSEFNTLVDTETRAALGLESRDCTIPGKYWIYGKRTGK